MSLSSSSAMSEARRFKTLTLSRAIGGGAGGVAMPQPTAQNQMVIANATPAWALLAAPAAQGQILFTGADPYMPAWTARFDATVPNVIQPDDAAAAGSASVAARRDHEHAIVCAAPASPSVNLAASAEGAGTSFARSDHAHQLAQNIAPTWTSSHSFTASVGFTRDAAALTALSVHVTGDSFTRFWVLAGGDLEWGGGENTFDVKLYRSAADTLRLEDTLIVDIGGVFNESGVDADFRVEASGQVNALFLRGSDGNIGLRTSAPANLLHAYATINDSHAIIIDAQGTANNQRATLDLITLGDGETPLGNAATLGWHLTARGNAYATAAQQNDLLMIYWNGTSWQHCQYWDHDGAVLVYENNAWARLSGTKEFHVTILSPEVGTYCQIRIPWDCTVTRFDGNTVGGTSCTVNGEERGTLGSSGTDILSSDMVADADGESVTSSFNNSSLAEGNHLTISISAISGAVSEVNIAVTVILT